MKRKLLKRFTAIIFALCVCIGQSGAVDAKPFTDVNENDWFYYAVAMVEDVGYMNGYPDGTFRPNATITRAECAQILFKVVQPDTSTGVLMDFADVPSNAWYYNAVSVMGGVFGGIKWVNSPEFTGAYFYPDQACTREDFAYGLALVSDIRGRSITLAHTGWSDYMDINPEYWEQIAGLYNLNIVSGSDDGKFHPKDTITRAEVAQILNNYTRWRLETAA